MAASPIFVSGTGRSGTWILYKCLGCHQAIHTFPREMRFLIDPDGLMPLVDALTIRYHPVLAREALFRFERLMRVYLTVPERAPYRGFDLPRWLGEALYREKLNQFFGELEQGYFDGVSWQVVPDHEGRLIYWAKKLTPIWQRLAGKPTVPYRLSLPRPRLKVVKYFSDRTRLLALCAGFVDDLFSGAAKRHGKQIWCEKTPQHLLNLEFLWDLFPAGVVVHMKRDPRGVVYSMTQQSWAPSELETACYFLRNVYERWNTLKQQLDLSQRPYLEFKLEEFARDPQCTLDRIVSLAGLENLFKDLPEVSQERVDHWKEKMTSGQVATVNRILSTQIQQMGYEV